MGKFKKHSFALIIICVLVAIGLGIKKHHFLASTEEVPGKISSFQASPDPDDDYATPVLEFEYQKQAKTVVNPYMVNHALFQVNQPITVIVNPNDLEEAQMKTPAFQYFPSAVLMLFAVLLGIIHLIIFRDETA